jgi:hypothetical protein
MAIAQATEVNYELHTLGWKAFQDLCAAVLAETLGQTFQVFAPGNDGGRDGAFRGSWAKANGVDVEGTFTAQCKFTNRPTTSLSLSLLHDEVKKAKGLAAQGLATNYLLLTNHVVSGTTAASVEAEFRKIDGIREFFLFGNEWLTQRIRASPLLRMLVPRVYGLGDLGQIMDERSYAQAKAILSSLGTDLSRFVITDAYQRSVEALTRHGFVLLLGEPASGKSTIAAVLALGALDNWKLSTLRVNSAGEFTQHWNAADPRQFFWVDDAFGATQYERELAYEWNRVLPSIHAAIEQGARIILTSRDYVYRAAKADLKEFAFPRLREAQVVIRVEELTDAEKDQIVYNHLKLGEQPVAFKSAIKPYLPIVGRVPKFLPEIARRLAHPYFTKSLQFSADSVRQFAEQPVDLLLDILTTLGRNELAALALIFMRGGAVNSPVDVTDEEAASLKRLGCTISDVVPAMQAMEESLVRLYLSDGVRHWGFRHPTIRDAIAGYTGSQAELLDIYLQGVATDRLLREVVCGPTAIVGARVVVPQSRYGGVLDRFGNVEPRQTDFFLAQRADRVFLDLFVRRFGWQERWSNPDVDFIAYQPAVRVIAKMHAVGLLPERERQAFVKIVSSVAVTLPDSAFLQLVDIRALFLSEEIDAVVKRFEGLLESELEWWVESHKSSYTSSGDDPREHFSELLKALGAFRSELERLGREQATDHLMIAIEDISDFIARAERDREEEEEGGRLSGPLKAALLTPEGPRSIFDDVDAPHR